MNEQTKAQRLAEWFEKGHGGCELEAAAELRRLDALNAELVEALEAMQSYAEAEGKGLRMCDEVLAKATGESND